MGNLPNCLVLHSFCFLFVCSDVLAQPALGDGQSTSSQQEDAQIKERVVVRARPLDSVAASVSVIKALSSLNIQQNIPLLAEKTNVINVNTHPNQE